MLLVPLNAQAAGEWKENYISVDTEWEIEPGIVIPWSKRVQIGTFSDDYLLVRFMEQYEKVLASGNPVNCSVDYGLWGWWVDNPLFDTKTKYLYCMSVKDTACYIFEWVANNPELTYEEKLAYYRTHVFDDNDGIAAIWWKENVEPKLEIGKTTGTDRSNYINYRDYIMGGPENRNTIKVEINGVLYYMDADEGMKCVEQGKLKPEPVYWLVDGTIWSHAYTKYVSNVGFDLGYMVY